MSIKELCVLIQNLQLIVGIIGIVGNILTIFVFRRKALRDYSYSFYIRSMAFSDTVMLTHTIKHWFALVLNLDIELTSPIICILSEYQPFVAGTFSIWMITLISIDRLAAVVYPNRTPPIIKQRWFQATLVAILLIYSLLTHLILPLNYELIELNTSNATTFVCTAKKEILNINVWIFLANFLVANVLINCVVNYKLISYIFASRRKFFKLYFPQRDRYFNTPTYLRDRKFAFTSIGYSLLCIICKVSFSMGILASNHLISEPDLSILMFTLSVSIVILNNSASFFVNLFINSLFHDEFYSMLSLRKTKYTQINLAPDNVKLTQIVISDS